MAIDIMAVSHDSGTMVMAPRRAAMEAEYDEQYILWVGPVSIKKSINDFVPLADTIADDSGNDWPAAKRRVSETPPRLFQDRSEQGE